MTNESEEVTDELTESRICRLAEPTNFAGRCSSDPSKWNPITPTGPMQMIAQPFNYITTAYQTLFGKTDPREHKILNVVSHITGHFYLEMSKYLSEKFGGEFIEKHGQVVTPH